MLGRTGALLLALGFVGCTATGSVAPPVTAYPLASYQEKSAVFTLLAGDTAVPVQHYHDYHYAHFEMTQMENPLELRVSSADAVLTEWTISPRSFGIAAETCAGSNDAALCFNVTAGNEQPNYLILQLNALQKLVIMIEEGAERVPAHGIDVRAPPFNADPTGVMDATMALQKAIDTAASRRVPVVLRNGTFLVSTPALLLRNHSDFFVAADAVMRSTSDISKLPPPDPKSASCFLDPMIMLQDVGDVTLRGRGTIDASGIALMQKKIGKGCKMKKPGFLYRRRIISSVYSKVEAGSPGAAHHGGRFSNIRIEGLTLRDATTWTAVAEKVANYTVFEVKVLNHHNASVFKIENDGLDLVANTDSSVDRCLVITCDDAMCSKSSEKDAGVDNVAFTNNIAFSWCAGQKAGMQAESAHQNVLFRNNDVVQARRGVVVEVTEGTETLRSVTFRGVRVETLVRTAGKTPQAIEVNAATAAIKNVSLFDVRVAGIAAARKDGDKEGAVWIHGKSAMKEDVEGVHFHGLRLDGATVLNAKAANLTAENAKDITFVRDARARHAAGGAAHGELLVSVAPSDCEPKDDCHAALGAAVARCRAHGPSCAVELAPGTYVVRCPDAPRPSSARTDAPAVSLDGLRGPVRFGGVEGRPRPLLLVDYVHGGCGAVVAANSSDVTVQQLVIDALRLPFTVATLADDATASTVSLALEGGAALGADRAAIYAWNATRWPWLASPFVTSAVVPFGTRATRQMPSAGLVGVHSATLEAATGVLRLSFPRGSRDTPDARLRAGLRRGQRVFVQHFENMQSWGVHGRNVSGTTTVSGVSLLSIAGMGFRCDLCTGTYLLEGSDIGIKPDSARPMSITADGVHLMHHHGAIHVRHSSVQGQGDDGLNVHGNFIVLDGLVGNGSVSYIDETGPGWLTAAPTFFGGDAVRFFSRRTLQALQGGGSRIVSATPSRITFDAAPPPGLRRFDMLLSARRVSSLSITDSFFGNSNARGAVISADGVLVRNSTFANLTLAAIAFFDGGCGAQPAAPNCPWCGDYTEGPFSANVTIVDNTFVACASEAAVGVANRGVVQLAGCVPLGACGISGGEARGFPDPVPFSFTPGAVARAQPFEPGGAVNVEALRYYVGAADANHSTAGTALGIFGRVGGANWTLLAGVDGGASWRRDGAWLRAPLRRALPLPANGTYLLAHWAPRGQTWRAAAVSPGYRLELDAPAGLPTTVSTGTAWANCTDSGLPVMAEWSPVGGWCDCGGTLPPPIESKPDDHGRGRITEPGALLQGHQVFTDVTLANNSFVAPPGSWHNSFVHAGAVAGLRIVGNRMARPSTPAATAVNDDSGRGSAPSVPVIHPAAPDVVVYSSVDVEHKGT